MAVRGSESVTTVFLTRQTPISLHITLTGVQNGEIAASSCIFTVIITTAKTKDPQCCKGSLRSKHRQLVSAPSPSLRSNLSTLTEFTDATCVHSCIE